MTKNKLLRELNDIYRQLSGITSDDECVYGPLDEAVSQLYWAIGQVEDAKTIEYDEEDDGK